MKNWTKTRINRSKELSFHCWEKKWDVHVFSFSSFLKIHKEIGTVRFLRPDNNCDRAIGATSNWSLSRINTQPTIVQQDGHPPSFLALSSISFLLLSSSALLFSSSRAVYIPPTGRTCITTRSSILFS